MLFVFVIGEETEESLLQEVGSTLIPLTLLHETAKQLVLLGLKNGVYTKQTTNDNLVNLAK